MNKILVLGYFGYNTNQLDGQTVKTRDVYKLISCDSKEDVDFYDTEDFQFNKFSIFFMFKKIINCNVLVYLPAHNNLKYIFPIIYIISVIFRIKICYFVVGGWLSDFICDMPIHKYMLSKINGIYVETKRLKKELEEYYVFNNVNIFPNFRFFDSKIQSNNIKSNNQLRLVFVSRVEKSKGLDTLLEVYNNYISHSEYKKYITLDIFGQKKDNFYDDKLIDIDFFNYNGVLEPEDVISTLNNYDALIFPSHYEGEGCPGILIEAMAAGLPIIASDWKYNNEFVDEGINGFLCNTFDAKSYFEVIINLLENRHLLYEMSINAKKKSEFYSADNACLLLKKYI